MKKLISLILVFSLMVSIPVFAIEVPIIENNNICLYNGNYIYSENTDEWNIIMTSTNNGSIEFDISYVKNPHIVYQLIIPIENFKHSNINYKSDIFWNEVKTIALNNLSKATVIDINKKCQIKGVFISTKGNATKVELTSQLEDIYGEEYSSVQIDESTDYAPDEVTANESLAYSVDKSETLTISDAITIAAFIAGLGGSGTLAVNLAKALGYASVAEVLLPDTSIDRYRSVAIFTRYGNVNGVDYTTTTRSNVHI